MFVWNDADDEYRFAAQQTAWMRLTDKFPAEYDFSFERKANDSDFVLACRCALGVNCLPSASGELNSDQGIKFIIVGSLNKKSRELPAAKEAKKSEVPDPENKAGEGKGGCAAEKMRVSGKGARDYQMG